MALNHGHWGSPALCTMLAEVSLLHALYRQASQWTTPQRLHVQPSQCVYSMDAVMPFDALGVSTRIARPLSRAQEAGDRQKHRLVYQRGSLSKESDMSAMERYG